MTLFYNNLHIYAEGSPQNQPIIYVHGFPYDHSMWDKVIENLSSQFYCVSYDIRGLGKSDPLEGQFTIESFTDDLFSIIDFMKLNRPVLCGLSMGGYISLRALEKNQDKFLAAVLCDTKSEADPNEVKIKRAIGVQKINQEGLDYFVKEFVPGCFSSEFIVNSSEEFQFILNRCKNSNPIGVKGCLIAMAARTDTTQGLSKFRLPVLVLCGEFDKLSPPSVMENMADKIKHSKFVIVPDAGHMTPIENPEFFTKQVLDFITKL